MVCTNSVAYWAAKLNTRVARIDVITFATKLLKPCETLIGNRERLYYWVVDMRSNTVSVIGHWNNNASRLWHYKEWTIAVTIHPNTTDNNFLLYHLYKPATYQHAYNQEACDCIYT